MSKREGKVELNIQLERFYFHVLLMVSSAIVD